MIHRLKGVWLNLSQSLGFVPGVIVFVFAVLGIALVQVDGRWDLEGVEYVFKGDGSAARTVLSVIAGSLITVAGLTFSITMVVLQLASTQFSPRILRTFFGDRTTQITIGTFVGTFVYAILVLRAVGSFGDAGFVPRLSVTLASLFGIGAVVLLIVFLQHVSQLVQVSHVTASIAQDTLRRMDKLFPETYGEPVESENGDALLRRWRAEDGEPGKVYPDRPGYVQRIGLDDLSEGLGDGVRRVAVLVCPGDFVSIDSPLAEVWPAEACEEGARGPVHDTISITDERDLNQDVDFGVRQLTDTALKAMSPGINDPMTAVTCISYLRSIFVRLTERAEPENVRRYDDRDLVVLVRRRRYEEYLESFVQISRYVAADAWVAGEMIEALSACARVASDNGAEQRGRAAREVAEAVLASMKGELQTDRDREALTRLMDEFGR